MKSKDKQIKVSKEEVEKLRKETLKKKTDPKLITKDKPHGAHKHS